LTQRQKYELKNICLIVFTKGFDFSINVKKFGQLSSVIIKNSRTQSHNQANCEVKMNFLAKIVTALMLLAAALAAPSNLFDLV
jgi:hypothetical protein